MILNKTFLIILLLFLGSFAFRLWGITGQFEVWDETAVVRNGEVYFNLWKDKDFSNDSWSLNKEHPPFSKYFYGASRFVSLKIPYFSNVIDQDYPLGRRYTFQRIVSAFVGSMSVVLLFLFVKKFYDEKRGIFASLILSFIPYFIAHSRVATQENLVGFLTLLSSYLFFSALCTRKLKHSLYIVSGIVLGLAISTKYNAFFFFILFAVLAFFQFKKSFNKNWKNLFNNYIIFLPVVALIIFIVIWPWLWSNPISQFRVSVNSRVGHEMYFKSANEYFLGRYPHNNPWYYFFVYFFATTPIVLLVGLGLFFIKLIKEKSKYDVWFSLYFLTPFLATFSPLKIDGIRYIFPIYPALAVLSSIGFYWLIKSLKYYVRGNMLKLCQKLIPVGVVSVLFFTALIYHPYYWDYYNSLVGGPKNVYEKRLFDFGYWGEGLRGAFGYLNGVAEKNKDKKIHVYYKIVPVHVIPSVASNLRKVDPIEKADFVIINPTGEWVDVTNYLDYDFPKSFKVVYEETVMDVPIVRVYKRVRPWGENRLNI